MTKLLTFTFGLFAVAIAAQVVAALLGIEGIGQVAIGAGATLGYLQAVLG